MNLKSIPWPRRYVVVALLFAICGALSAAYLLPSRFPDRVPMILPIPFALLCALLFLHTLRAVFAVPLIVAVWLIAYSVTFFVGFLGASIVPVPLFLGGFISGIGLVLCVSTCRRRLLSRKYIFRGAKISTIGALAFAPWLWSFLANLNNYRPPQWLLICAFAIWQATVGTYLYAIYTGIAKGAQPEGSQRVNPIDGPVETR